MPFSRHRLFKVKKWVSEGNSGKFEPGFEPDPLANLEETTDLNYADIVSSESASLFSFESKHMVMFDVDIPMAVVPSSTPGHQHVYFDTYVPKEKLFELLDVLADCGIVERGYAQASRARGFTALRLPWVRKSIGSRPVCEALRRRQECV